MALYYSQARLKIYQGNSLEILPELGFSAHCCVTSIPYFAKIDYQEVDQLGVEARLYDYLNTQMQVFRQIYLKTVEGGFFWLNIGDSSNNYSPVRSHMRERKQVVLDCAMRRQIQPEWPEKVLLDIPWRIKQAAIAAGWLYWGEVIWNKGRAGRPTGERPVLSHEPIWLFLKWQGGRRPKPLYWNGEVIPQTVLTVPPESDEGHPCPLPLALVKPLIDAACPPEGIVLDPFFGRGTVGRAALELGRQAVGIELSQKFCDRAIAYIGFSG